MRFMLSQLNASKVPALLKFESFLKRSRVLFEKILPAWEQNLFIGALLAGVAAASFLWAGAPSLPPLSELHSEASAREARAQFLRKQHTAPPKEVRGIYMSAYTASDKGRRERLFKLIDETELNAVVIDIKDSTGLIFFDARNPLFQNSNAVDGRITDLHALLADLKQRGIWTIARQVVFQDPRLAEARPDLAVQSRSTKKSWRDRRGLRWMDPASREVWDYNVALAREAIARGFNEVQFDYIRFPSDGDIGDMRFPVWDGDEPKYEVMRDFFEYLDKSLHPTGAKLSVDLFGMTFSRVDKLQDDLNIGQRVVDAAPFMDYISPMVYPSHYPPNFEGYANPAEHPYAIVNIALEDARPFFRNNFEQVRPWLQDFDLGAEYTAAMVKAQIKAVRDNKASGWLLWNPSNIYTSAALDKE